MIAIHPGWSAPRVFKGISGRITGSGDLGKGMVYYTTRDSFFVAIETGIQIRTPIRLLFPDNNAEYITAANFFQQIAIDRTTGQVWCFSPRGVRVFNRDIQLLYDLKQEAPYHIYHVQIDEQHLAWLSTTDGLIQVRCDPNPSHLMPAGKTDRVQGRLVLTECRVYSRKTRQLEDVLIDYFHDGKIKIHPDHHFVQMHFAVTDSLYSGRIDYVYKVEGYENEWRSMDKNVLNLAGLEYGDYKVLVQAKTANGVYAGQALTIPISILRPFYLQPGFVLLFALVLLGFFQGYKKYKNVLIKGFSSKKPAPSAEDALEREEELTPETPEVLQNPEDVAFLEKLQSIVLEHLDKPKFNAEMLSKLVGLSMTQLHRRLTTLTGLSTGRYIYSIRLQEAKQRIEQTNLTISEIAYQTGFSDPAYFTRLFTKMFKYPPSYFREK